MSGREWGKEVKSKRVLKGSRQKARTRKLWASLAATTATPGGVEFNCNYNYLSLSIAAVKSPH